MRKSISRTMNLKQTSVKLTVTIFMIAALYIQNTNEYNLNNEDAYNGEHLEVEGKNNDLKLKPSKLNTNKEFVFGDEDDEDDKQDLEVPSSDLNMLNSNPLETDMNHSDESSEEELLSQLKRSQRVDVKHPAHEKQLTGLLKFNKMADLQKKLLELSDNKHNFDYDILIDDDFFDENKKTFKKKLKSEKKADLLEEDDDDKSDEDHNPEDTITVEELLTQLENKIKSQEKVKTFKPTLEIKEQIYLEGIYNKHHQKQNSASKLNGKNSFFNPINQDEINRALEMVNENPEQMNTNGSSGFINSNPSLKMKTEHTHSSVDSKFEMIKRQNDYLFLFVVAGCTLAGVLALLAASVCWYTVTKSSRTRSSNLEFESSKHSIFQNTGNSSAGGSIKSKGSNSSGDKKLALSAQMYHYQHQKEQMIAMEKANNETKPDNSDNSDDETPEGDYTVYECPGLAPTGEMEVKNPLFKEEFSASLSSIKTQPPPSYSTVALTTTIINETSQPVDSVKPDEQTADKKE